MLANFVLSILEWNWNLRFRKWEKLNICDHDAHVVHTTAKQVVSRRGKNENVCQMSKVKKLHVQSVQNYCFSLSNMQIYEVLVAVVGNCNEKVALKLNVALS